MKCAISLSIKSEYDTWGDFLFKEYVDFFEGLGIKVVFIPNGAPDPVFYMKDLSLDGLILSGGNDVVVPASNKQKYKLSFIRNSQEGKMLDFAVKMKMPVLGICRGMQFINYYFGGAIVPDIGREVGVPLSHVNTIHSVIIEDSKLLSLLKKKEVLTNSYHRQGFFERQIAPSLRIAARAAKDGVVEAVYHPSLPIMGMQWHPERKGGNISTNKNIAMAFKRRICYWSRSR